MRIINQYVSIPTLRSAIIFAWLRWTHKKSSRYRRIPLLAFCSSASPCSILSLLACRPTNVLINTLFVIACFVFCGTSLGKLKIKKRVTPNPIEILKSVDRYRSPAGIFSFQVEVKDFEGKELLKETTYRVYSYQSKKVLIETLLPKRLLGRKLLFADALWLFLPSLKRPTMVSPHQRLTGEVSNGDISRLRFVEDYAATIIDSQRKPRPAWKLNLKAKKKDSPYQKIHLWVKEENRQPLRATYFALSGKPLKTGEYSEPKLYLGGMRMTRLVLKDAVETRRRSEIRFSDYKRENLEESFFDKESISD